MFLLHKILLSMILLVRSLSAFEIDPFNPNASLVENFSTNCLQMTQSQQMLKAYLMIGLNSTFQNPKENLAKAIVDYDRRAHQVHDYFFKMLGDKIRKRKKLSMKRCVCGRRVKRCSNKNRHTKMR